MFERAVDESALEGLAAVEVVDIADDPDLETVEDVGAAVTAFGTDALAKLLTMTVAIEVILVGVTVLESARMAATCGPRV